MNVVIIGDGKVGHTLSAQLANEGHNITVIDQNPAPLQNSRNRLDVNTFEGNGANYDVQVEAGVAKADLLIAATSRDELNILSCVLGKKLGAANTIARIRNPEYLSQLDFLKQEMGLSLTINPEFEASLEILRILRFPSAINIETLAGGRVEIVEIKLEGSNPLIGTKLLMLTKQYNTPVLCCSVRRDDEVFIPDGEFIFAEHDKVSFTGKRVNITNFFKQLDILKTTVKNVMVIGGGSIALYLAKGLWRFSIKTTIIEKDQKRCKELCALLPDSKIICGDGTDQDVLREEGVEGSDAVVSLTGMDEQNIIIAMYAQTLAGVKVITKVNRQSFFEIIENSGIESIICPKLLAANQIVHYVRAIQNTVGSSINAIYRLLGGKVEAREFELKSGAAFMHIPLKELKIKKGYRIICIIRKSNVVFPTGNTKILPFDTAIVVTTEKNLQELKGIFL